MEWLERIDWYVNSYNIKIPQLGLEKLNGFNTNLLKVYFNIALTKTTIVISLEEHLNHKCFNQSLDRFNLKDNENREILKNFLIHGRLFNNMILKIIATAVFATASVKDK